MKQRHLVSMRRRVPPERRGEYNAAWERLRRSATTYGAHAWRFISAGRNDLYLEFLEFAADADPRDQPDVTVALGDLDSAFQDSHFSAEPVEEWREIRQDEGEQP